MPATRRIIRKTEPARRPRVDDQFWPVAVAMVVLGGFLAGTVLAYLRLDDPRWYANAVTWLLAVPLVICAALGWLAVTGNRHLRRSMQLAVVLGVIIHVLLFVVAVETNVFQHAWMQVVAAMDRYEKKELVKVPDYASWQHDPERRASRDLEQPVATSLPEPTPDDVERQLLAQQPTAEEQQPRPQPEPEETVRPDVVKRQERNESNPRQRDETSRLSRKIGPVPPLPTQSIRLPDVARQEERRDESPEAPALGMAPARLESPPARQDHDQEPRTSEPSPRTDVARKLPDVSPRPESPSVAALDRQIAKPLVVPRTDVETPGPPSVPRQTDAQELLPNQTVTQGQQTRASRIQPRVEPPAQEIASQVSSRPRRPEQPDPRQPTVARVPPSLPTPRTPAAPRPDVPTTAEPVAAAGSNPRSETPLAPTANSEAQRDVVAVPLTEAGMQPRAAPERTDQDPAARSERRQQSAAPALPETLLTQTAPSGRRAARTPPTPTSSDHAVAAGAPMPATDASAATATAETSSQAAVPRQAAASPQLERPRPANDSPSDVAASQTLPRPAPRTEVSGGPAAASSALPNGSPQRAQRPAPVPVSPVLAQHPAQTSAGDSPAAAQPEPATTALSKADVGMAGRGESPNLGRGDPSVEGAATVASGSAPRAQATQAAPPGPALTPHEAALVRSGRAGQTAPSSVLRASPLSLSAAHGSHRPTEMDASASAAATRASSNAPAGDVTASPGNLAVDTGPTILVPESGAGRAAGGGQPRRSSGTERPPLPRADSSREAMSSLMADTVARLPAALASVGDGEPGAADLAADPQAMVNARQGGPADSAAGPRTADAGSDAAPSASPSPAGRRTSGDLPGLESVAAASQTANLARRAPPDRQLPSAAGASEAPQGEPLDSRGADEPASPLAAGTGAGQSVKQPSAPAVTKPADQEDPSATAATDGAPAGGRTVRAAAAESEPDPVLAGGGSQSPVRAARGPEVVADSHAQAVELAGAPESGGGPDGMTHSSQGEVATRLAAGMDVPAMERPVGTVASDVLVEVTTSDVPGTGIGRNERSVPEGEAPAVHDARQNGGPGKRASRTRLAQTPVAAAEGVPAQPAATMPDEPDASLAAGSPDRGAPARAEGAALPADVVAAPGPGGVGSDLTVEVGLNTRRASPTSQEVHLETVRFPRQQVGGMPEFNAAAAMAAPPFQQRVRRGEGAGEATDGPGPQTEEAIELGLAFLSRAQETDGRWQLSRFAQRDGMPQMASDSAATGLAILAYQGAGYHHLKYRYADVVRRGINFLVENQTADGSLFVPMDDESNLVVRLYSHSIAALALSEAYGMTQDSALREPAQKALDYIVNTQSKERGGWRYTPGVSTDTSVTGWMMMALKSGELAKLDVPDNTYRRVIQWLDQAQASPQEPHLYCYNPFAPDTPEQKSGQRPTPTMTSVGLLMRLYSGWRRDNPHMIRGARYLLERPPAIGTRSNPQRDTYYWYYATQIMFHMGGQYWEEWNSALHPCLVDTQIRGGEFAGSWDPLTPVPDRWAPFAGRLYVTTMNLLSLEVYYRHLPLYEDTGR